MLHEHFKTATFSKPNPENGQLQSETLRLGESPRFQPLVEAIRYGTPLPAGPREGFVAALLVEKITTSIQSGQVQKIEMPPELS